MTSANMGRQGLAKDDLGLHRGVEGGQPKMMNDVDSDIGAHTNVIKKKSTFKEKSSLLASYVDSS